MKCSAWPPAPTLRKIPSSNGRIWNKNACAGRGGRRPPFPCPTRCGSLISSRNSVPLPFFPPIRCGPPPPISPRAERGRGAPAAGGNGKTIIEHSVRCVSIFLKPGAFRRFPKKETGKVHLAGRRTGPKERARPKGLLSGKGPFSGTQQHIAEKETP